MQHINNIPSIEMQTSYLYNRENPIYYAFGVFKNGFTENIPNRHNVYNTGDLFPGTFTEVYEFVGTIYGHITAKWVEHELHEYLIENTGQTYYGAGTEFFKTAAKPLIEPFLDKLKYDMCISYKKLSAEEINCLVRKQYAPSLCNTSLQTSLSIMTSSKKVRKPRQKRIILPQQPIVAPSAEKTEQCCPGDTQNENTTPRDNNVVIAPVTYSRREYQTDIIQTAVNHFQTCDKGVLILPCGCGKTIISIWTCLDLNAKTILIGVPNTLLLNQWKTGVETVFYGVPCFIVQGGVSIEKIQKFITTHSRFAIITTYASAHKVLEATVNKTGFQFDIKIHDEAHHLTTGNIMSSNDTKAYVKMLEIPATKTLSLTATIKHVESVYEHNSISNEDVMYFGQIIEKQSVLWAIERGIICDYIIQTILTDEDKLEDQFARFHITEDTDKRLFLGAFSAVKSIQDSHSHHLLVYSNSKEHSNKIVKFISTFLSEQYFDIPGLYYADYHSEMKPDTQAQILRDFERSPVGIISCVYCLGEGWDFPILDGEVFAENMTSNIRIVQSALRAIRKDPSNPSKIAKIILPILNRDDWLENSQSPDLKKVSEVIYQMGLEDETISQKIKAYYIQIGPQPPRNPSQVTSDISLGTYDPEFTAKLRLKTVKRTALATTYEKARAIIFERRIGSKAEYYALCSVNNRLPEDPENTFQSKFGGWIEYLSITREKYYDYNTCRAKTREHLQSHPEIKTHYLNMERLCIELCNLDPMYPPCDLWTDMYSVGNIRDIIEISFAKKKKNGAI